MVAMTRVVAHQRGCRNGRHQGAVGGLWFTRASYPAPLSRESRKDATRQNPDPDLSPISTPHAGLLEAGEPVDPVHVSQDEEAIS